MLLFFNVFGDDDIEQDEEGEVGADDFGLYGEDEEVETATVEVKELIMGLASEAFINEENT